MTISLLDSIYIVAIINGFGLSFFLFTSKKSTRITNNILATLLLFFSLWLIDLFLISSKLIYHAPQLFRGFPTFLTWTVGPLVYLFSKSKVDQHFKFELKNYFLFLPAIYFLFFGKHLLFFEPEIAVKYVLFFYDRLDFMGDQARISFVSNKSIIWSIIRIVYDSTFFILALSMLKSYNKLIKNNFSNIEKYEIKYVWLLVRGLFIIRLIFIVLWLVELFFFPLYGSIIAAILMSIFYFILGYLELKRPIIPVELISKRDIHCSKTVEEINKLKFNIDPIQIENKLNKMMKSEKLFLNPELSILELAESISIPSYQLSYVLNEHMKQSFYNYINGLRIEEAKHQLINPENDQFTILAISLDVGFKSKTTFNSVFKKSTGITPSAYRQSKK